MVQVVISYSREDSAVADRLYADLSMAGVKAWMDTKNVVAGKNWKHAVSAAIRNASHVLVLFSQKSTSRRGYMHKEIREAISVQKERPPGTSFIVPVKLDACEIAHEDLADLRYVRLFPRYDSGLEMLIKALRPEALPQAEPEVLTSQERQDEMSDFQGQQDDMDRAEGTRFVEDELPRIIMRLKERGQRVFSIIFVDVDGLTAINKHHGTEVGDTVLEAVGEIIRRRSAARYKGRCGDDTFYAVLFGAKDPSKFCERLRGDIQLYQWRVITPKLRVTCSMGYAKSTSSADNPYEIIMRSIMGMLEGKESGGNAVRPGPLFSGQKFKRVVYHSVPSNADEFVEGSGILKGRRERGSSRTREKVLRLRDHFS